MGRFGFNKNLSALIVFISFCVCTSSQARTIFSGDTEHISSAAEERVYVANNDSLQQVMYVLGGVIGKPIVVSPEAARKRVTGNFDLTHPKDLLNTLASKTGLIWYDDGSSIYFYDNSEIESRMVRLAYAPFDRLVAYLQSTGLYDARFPVRSDGHAGAFYVSGPPVYVDLIEAAAKYIDATYAKPGTGETTIRVIQLRNTFVNDRTFTQRDKPVTVPGIASVLRELMGANGYQGSTARISVDNDTRHAMEVASDSQSGHYPALPAFTSTPSHKDTLRTDPEGGGGITIVAYSDTNSLMIQGTEQQVSFVEDMVRVIDVPKHQIQLSLWIIDIKKENVDELGVKWQGSATLAGNGVTINNSSLTPSSSLQFLANVTALVDKQEAEVVSHPEILTQENIPALFDNNTSFYAKLSSERSSSLEKVTYGTMISVLPRLDLHDRNIEMLLNIHDGGLPSNEQGGVNQTDALPLVNDTQISTEARVPVGYSLLVGGYSRDQDIHHNLGVPVLRDIPVLGKLFDYSYASHTKMVRLFLIQPRLMVNGETWQGYPDTDTVLGRDTTGNNVTLKATVSMLRKLH